GTTETVVDASELVLAHALFKAALFMVVGIVDHQAGTRDIRLLRRPGPGWGPVSAIAVVSAASMAGFPLMFGFVAKEDAFAGLEPGSFAHAGLVLAPIAAASVLTVAYSAHVVWGLLGRSADDSVADATPARPVPPPRPAFVAPAALLGALTVLFGVVPGLLDRLMTAAGESLTPDAEHAHLVVWHGWNLPLLLSAVVLAGGAALFAARRLVGPVPAVGPRVPGGGEANRTTAVVQSGSLPVYAGVILTTAASATTLALVLGEGWPGWPSFARSVGHVAVCLALIATALGAAAVHRRFSAALLLGATGYA